MSRLRKQGYSRWQQVGWLIDDGHPGVAPPLREPTLGHFPGLAGGIQELDGGEVHDTVVPTHYVEQAVHHASSSVPAGGGHVRKGLPLFCSGVVSVGQNIMYKVELNGSIRFCTGTWSKTHDSGRLIILHNT